MDIYQIISQIVAPILFLAVSVVFTALKVKDGKAKALALLWQAVQNSAQWALADETAICKFVAETTYAWIPSWLRVFVSAEKWLGIVTKLFDTIMEWADANGKTLEDLAKSKVYSAILKPGPKKPFPIGPLPPIVI